jgi:hypothetical protein
MLAEQIITIKGFVEGWNLYAKDKVYDLLNGYALSDTKEHGFFQITKKSNRWWVMRKIITHLEKI